MKNQEDHQRQKLTLVAFRMMDVAGMRELKMNCSLHFYGWQNNQEKMELNELVPVKGLFLHPGWEFLQVYR